MQPDFKLQNDTNASLPLACHSDRLLGTVETESLFFVQVGKCQGVVDIFE